MGVTSSMRH